MDAATPEQRRHLLLRAILSPETCAARDLDDLWSDAGWLEATLDAVEAHGLFYSALKRAGLEAGIPASLRDRMRREHATSTALNLELVHEARGVQAAMRDAGLDVVALKGLALFLRGTHRDAGARPTIDMDLLTRQEDRARVCALLERRGWRQDTAGGWPKHLPAFRRGHLMIEVHEIAYWSLRDGRPWLLDDMLDRGDGGARLDRTMAHLVHHLFESSVRTPALFVKTLWDVNEMLVWLEPRPDVASAIETACAEAGLLRQWRALCRTRSFVAGATPLADAEVRDILDACRPADDKQMWDEQMRYLRKAVLEYPGWMRSLAVRTIFAPNRATMEQLYGVPAGSPWMWMMYGIRPFHLAWRGMRRSLAGALRRPRGGR